MTAKLIAFWGLLSAGGLLAETGRDAWLRYEALDEAAARPYRESLPAVVAALGDAPTILSARQEILRGVRGMLGRTLRVEAGLPRENAIVIGTLDALRRKAPALALASGGDLTEDAFRLRTVAIGGVRYTVIAAANPRGALYGAFALLRKIGLRESIANLDETQTPYAPVRWVNQWDNLDGSIERGYGGRSIFWENGAVRADLTRAGEYARLLASVGINACSVNNVNANPKALSPEILKQVARIADVFRPWGVRLALSVDFCSPRMWAASTLSIRATGASSPSGRTRRMRSYRFIPDLAGFVLKADSKGRLVLPPTADPRRRRQRGGARAQAARRPAASTAASSTTTTWTGETRRTTAAAPPGTTSSRWTASSTTT